jgi:hypothetical protein
MTDMKFDGRIFRDAHISPCCKARMKRIAVTTNPNLRKFRCVVCNEVFVDEDCFFTARAQIKNRYGRKAEAFFRAYDKKKSVRKWWDNEG